MTHRTPHGEMVIITVNVPKYMLKHVQVLMGRGITPSRSEYFRRAVSNQIERDAYAIKYVDTFEEKVRIPKVEIPKGYELIPGYEEPVKVKRLEY